MSRITWSLSRSCAESTPANPTMSGPYQAQDKMSMKMSPAAPKWSMFWMVSPILWAKTSPRWWTAMTVIPRQSYIIIYLIISQVITQLVNLIHGKNNRIIYLKPQWLPPLPVTKVLQHNCNNFSDEAPGAIEKLRLDTQRKGATSFKNCGEWFLFIYFFSSLVNLVREFRLQQDLRHKYTWMT